LKSTKMVGAILVIVAIFKMVTSIAILGNLMGLLQFVADLSIIDLVIGAIVLLVGLYLIRK